MRPIKQKMEYSGSGEPWIEPEPAFQAPGTSWHPLDPVPPFQILPRIKKHKHPISLSVFAISPDLSHGPLTNSNSVVTDSKPNDKPEARSNSIDSEDAVKIVEELPISYPEWKRQKLVFKQPLTPSDPDNVFKQHAVATGSSRSKALSDMSTPRVVFTHGVSREVQEPIVSSPADNFIPSSFPQSAPPASQTTPQKQLVIKLRTSTSYSDGNENSGSSRSKSGLRRFKSSKLINSFEENGSFQEASSSSSGNTSNTDDDYKAPVYLKLGKNTNGNIHTRRHSRNSIVLPPSDTTPKRPRSPSLTPPLEATPTKKKRGRKPKKVK